MVSTLLSFTTSRTTIEVVVPPRPALAEPVDVTPTSAKFLRPAGWTILLSGDENSFHVIGLLTE